MEALILSCGTGGGHDAAARAMQEELLRRGHRVTMMNPYELKSGQLVKMIDQGYIKLVQKSPRGFGVVYRLGDLYRNLPFHSPVYFLNGKMENVMSAYMKEHHFDVVLMTHLFPAEIMTHMKNQGKIVPKTILIATDYTCIPFMEETDCDAYVVPSQSLVHEFLNRGIEEKLIHPLGIPIHRNFEVSNSRRKAMEELQLDVTKRYVLISGGSMGAGNIEIALEAMINWAKPNAKIRFIVICGTNDALYHRLTKKFAPQEVRVIGYTNRLHLYLKASVLYVTKPGGLSSTEAAVMGIPILHISPIPGCETINARYFENTGMSMALEKIGPQQISYAMRTLGGGELRRQMVNMQRKHIPAGAAKRIADLAEKMTEGNSTTY